MQRFYAEQAGMLNGSHMHNIISGKHGGRGPIVMITHKKNSNVLVRYRPGGRSTTHDLEFRSDDVLQLATPE